MAFTNTQLYNTYDWIEVFLGPLSKNNKSIKTENWFRLNTELALGHDWGKGWLYNIGYELIIE